MLSSRRRSSSPMARQVQFGRVRALIAVLLLALAVSAAAGLWLYRDYQRFSHAPLGVGTEPVVIDIARGTSFRGVVARLAAVHLDGGVHELYWRALAWQHGARVQAGEYAIEASMTPLTLLEKLRRGEVIQYRFTLVEGWSVHELRLALARDPVLVQTLAAVPEDELMAHLGVRADIDGDSDETRPEGLFLPETYQFTRGTTDAELLKRAHAALVTALNTAWRDRAPDLPLANPYEALVLASIVEKETGLASERPQVAGVFLRRLRLGMRLQTDPSVIYGLGPGFSGSLTRANLEADTPHNTYTRDGLPPTPIALPGREAIQASLHPAPGDALYFVARGDGPGHVFSRTLAEHNRAVADYRRSRRP